MPIHGYECQKRKKEYEVLYLTHSDVEKDEPNEKCPDCGSTEKKRLIPKNTSFQLKGKGWFKDGY